MKFDGIKKVSEGRFINRYDLYYTTEDDKKKVYEIISRNKDIKTIEDIRNRKDRRCGYCCNRRIRRTYPY